MKTVKIMIMRQAVIDEVGKSTAYAGAKSTGDSAADFNRVATIGADDELLGRFWNEAAVAVTAVCASSWPRPTIQVPPST